MAEWLALSDSGPPLGHDQREGSPRLLLASASPARLRTLRAAGIEPVVQPADLDESDVVHRARKRREAPTPTDEALVLARAKAEAVAAEVSGIVILGCDSVLELDGHAYGKPSGPDEAAQRWRLMRGRSGVLHTGHWVIDGRSPGGTANGAVASTTVYFADLSDIEIDAYIATGEPLDVAGAFTIDGLGAAFVERIEGDPHNVVGLSLPLLRRLLAGLRIQWTDLWNTGD